MSRRYGRYRTSRYGRRSWYQDRSGWTTTDDAFSQSGVDVYDLALRQAHLARLSVGGATGRDVLQVFRVEMIDPGDEYATFDVLSSRAWDRNPSVSAAVDVNATPADYAADVLALALDDTNVPLSSDVDPLIVCDMAVTAVDQPSAHPFGRRCECGVGLVVGTVGRWHPFADVRRVG